MTNVVVTGGAGFLGSRLARQLLAAIEFRGRAPAQQPRFPVLARSVIIRGQPVDGGVPGHVVIGQHPGGGGSLLPGFGEVLRNHLAELPGIPGRWHGLVRLACSPPEPTPRGHGKACAMCLPAGHSRLEARMALKPRDSASPAYRQPFQIAAGSPRAIACRVSHAALHRGSNDRLGHRTIGEP